MNFLKIDEKKAYFILKDDRIEPEKLSRDDLVKILNIVYENHAEVVFPEEDEFNSIVNPIEREIVEQITAKIEEFHANVPNIKKEINNQFPKLDNQV